MLIDSLETLKNFTVENINIINTRLDKLETYMLNYFENKTAETINHFPTQHSVPNIQKESKSTKNMLSPKNIKSPINSQASYGHSDTTWNEILLNLKVSYKG